MCYLSIFIISLMEINKYLDSTYLKTSAQAGISEEKTQQKIKSLIKEALNYKFILVMIRPKYVAMAKEILQTNKQNLLIGTVIGFPEGTHSVEHKLQEAQKAIKDGADELDFVVNYKAFKEGKINLVKSEVFKASKLVLKAQKTIKWIIEVAALNNDEIEAITKLIKDVIIESFGEEVANRVFVKSSTGFYKTEEGKPNGATFETMQLIAKQAKPLQIKAAGGVRSFEDAKKMIQMGVNRIGTSSAKEIFEGKNTSNSY